MEILGDKSRTNRLFSILAIIAIIFPMAQLIVRGLDEDIVRRLKMRAAERGRSAEAEHREILKAALFPENANKPSLKEFILNMPDVGDDRDFRRSRGRGRKIDL
jgi:plasmid stability protein